MSLAVVRVGDFERALLVEKPKASLYLYPALPTRCVEYL
jgi:hypothetical protein